MQNKSLLSASVVNANTRTSTAKKWLIRWLMVMRHNPPNADSINAQVSNIGAHALFEQYERWCSEARELPLEENSFRGVFSTIKRSLDIVMRTSKQGSAKCFLCSLLDEVLSVAVGFAEKEWIKAIHLEHIAFHNHETILYEKDCFEAKDPGSGITSICVDGAKASSHSLPKVASAGRDPKNIPVWPQKLQGVLMHGKSISLFNLFHGLKSGSNMMLTTLLRAMQLEELSPRDVIKLKVDGGSENWNVIVLAFIDLMFDMYPELKEVFISRFGVGHTHNDLDRLFSYINQMVFGISAGGKKAGKTILTRESFFDVSLSALAGKTDTMYLEKRIEDLLFTYDFKSFLEPHLYSEFRGHGSSGQIHVFRFRRVADRKSPHISYKYWHQSPTWLPADGSSLQILSTRPDLRDVKEVSPLSKSAMGELPGLQKSVLKWLARRVEQGLATQGDIELWRVFFKKVPGVSTFPLLFPDSVARTSSTPTPFAARPLPAVSASRQSELANVAQVVLDEQSGPSVEPIPYPGYTNKKRKQLEAASRGGRGAVRGRGRGRGRSGRGGRGRGASQSQDVHLDALLAQTPNTDVDSFYYDEIVCERWLYDQRQYQVTWHSSVTSKHKGTFKTRVRKVLLETSDRKHALVEWLPSWELAISIDSDEDQQDMLLEWKQYCLTQGEKTPLSPPSSDDDEEREREHAEEEEQEAREDDGEEQDEDVDVEEKEAQDDDHEEQDEEDEEDEDDSAAEMSEGALVVCRQLLSASVRCVYTC